MTLKAATLSHEFNINVVATAAWQHPSMYIFTL